MVRDQKYKVLYEIEKRWSPRAFSNEKINMEDVYGVIEAARLAPSCFNEQPWKYIVAYEEKDLSVMRDLIDPFNRVWSDKAPVLIAILSKKKFKYNHRENYWHMFDAGASWGYLTIEAQRRGLITRGIGGFNSKRARSVLNVPIDYEVIMILALGKMGDIHSLPENLIQKEKPGERLPLEEVIYNGKFGETNGDDTF